MFRRYFERRERYLHGRDDNRKSLPFEWGLEYLGLDGKGNAEAALCTFVQLALNDSASFYGCSPAPVYEFDGRILKFPSAVETPFPENDLVWSRFFEGGRDLALIILPQWNCKWDGQLALCRALRQAGITSLRLSLPYHHQRKPPHLDRAEYLVSPNIGRTIAAIRQAVLDTRRAADWLVERGYRRIGILGTSIGSCIGFLALAHDCRLATGVFIHVSSFFADVVWSGLSTSHVRRSLEGAVDLDRLRYYWSPISPYPFINRLRGSRSRMLMLSGRFDSTFLPGLSRQTYEELDRSDVRYTVCWFPCGHYTMGEFPFNLLAGYRIIRFLKQAT